ncbi:hypothetical protein EF847_04410 [Actinobacteria bacterium YIM 96077]|uniref:GerMN domain-containing protein n=1 Tax=Phytoactinopolyspora halophila TaxID=1981511 RepID=A0A329R5E7_9ACTN|nr:LpqB family beta-propeller domain-containing protein [Phytoactinopolyspora halophila]AYY12064.1 hypothetical protein EF847_04410 [Actinobacteria bacterium YIM 96077]RAW18702.1 hypothetical protein DPM12_01100 [Phytoactinopolyspora halophila]
MGSKSGAALLLAIGLLSAGCTQIPTSGPVVSGDPVRAQNQPPYVAFGAAAPQEGEDVTGIVDGFVDAMSAYHPGYETAKMFLTPEAASTWEPTAQIIVHQGTRPSIELVDDDRVQLSVTVAGTVMPDGSYVTTDADTTRTFELSMERVEGEWRIAEPPDGTIISEENFAREFEAHDLCFFDPAFELFVPDPVYVPKNGQPATLLAQMLLDGPSEWVGPAVSTAFPESTTLSVSSVPVENRTATVELSEEAQETQPEERELMAAQLGCTLGGMPEVGRVAMYSDGISLLGQGAPPVGADDYERYDSERIPAAGSLYAMRDSGMVVMHDDGSADPVPGPLGGATDVNEVAVDASGSHAAAVAAGRTQLQIAELGEGDVRDTVLEGVELASPVWDRQNLIWAVDRSEGRGELVAVDREGAPVQVQAPELQELDISRFAISPEGSRMVLVADGRAYVALVVRDGAEPNFVSVERLRPVGPAYQALDVGWSGAGEIAVLAQNDEGELPEVLILDIFGAVQAERGAVPGAVSLATGPDQPHMVSTEDGALYEHESRTRWINVADGWSPTYP